MIPLFNYGHFLAECVESILAQRGVDVDILIIDDASTDDSLSVARALAAKVAADRGFPIRVVANEQNRGMVATINDGLWQVTAEYVVKLDADDIVAPGALARATALLEAHPSVGFVYGFPVVFTESPPPAARTKVRSWTVWSGRDWIELMCCRGSNTIMQPEVVMRTSVLHKAGLYDPGLPHGSDFEMWLRLAAIADVGRVNGAHQGFYRVHPNSMQRTVNSGYSADLRAAKESFEGLFSRCGDRLPEVDRLRKIAMRAVAVAALDKTCRAYDAGTAELEPVDEYLAIAVDAYAEVQDLRQWKSVDRRQRSGPNWTPSTPSAAITRTWRDLEDRIRWRRWRWSGV